MYVAYLPQYQSNENSNLSLPVIYQSISFCFMYLFVCLFVCILVVFGYATCNECLRIDPHYLKTAGGCLAASRPNLFGTEKVYHKAN